MANICTNYVFVKDGDVAELIKKFWKENLESGCGVTLSDILIALGMKESRIERQNSFLESVTPINTPKYNGVLFQCSSKWEAPEETFDLLNTKCDLYWFAEEPGFGYARTNDFERVFFKDRYLWDDGQSEDSYEEFEQLKHEFCLHNDISYRDFCKIETVEDLQKIIEDNLLNQNILEVTYALNF